MPTPPIAMPISACFSDGASGSLNVHHGSCTSKDGAFSFANTVPGVFENAKNADGFVDVTPLKPSHRVRIQANICEDCRTIVFDY